MYTLLIIAPIPVLGLLSGYTSRKMLNLYNTRHKGFLRSIKIDQAFTGSLSLINSGSFVHPVSNERVNIINLLSDIEIIELQKDKELISLHKLRAALIKFLIVYTPISPIIIVLMWLYAK